MSDNSLSPSVVTLIHRNLSRIRQALNRGDYDTARDRIRIHNGHVRLNRKIADGK